MLVVSNPIPGAYLVSEAVVEVVPKPDSVDRVAKVKGLLKDCELT